MDRSLLFWVRLGVLILIFWTVVSLLGAGGLVTLALQHRDNGTCETTGKVRGPMADCR